MSPIKFRSELGVCNTTRVYGETPLHLGIFWKVFCGIRTHVYRFYRNQQLTEEGGSGKCLFLLTTLRNVQKYYVNFWHKGGYAK
jgi:hypothetical protein